MFPDRYKRVAKFAFALQLFLQLVIVILTALHAVNAGSGALDVTDTSNTESGIIYETNWNDWKAVHFMFMFIYICTKNNDFGRHFTEICENSSGICKKNIDEFMLTF